MGSRAEVTTLLLLLLFLSTTLKSNNRRKVGRKACLRGNSEDLLLVFGNERQALKEKNSFVHVHTRCPAVPPELVEAALQPKIRVKMLASLLRSTLIIERIKQFNYSICFHLDLSSEFLNCNLICVNLTPVHHLICSSSDICPHSNSTP